MMAASRGHVGGVMWVVCVSVCVVTGWVVCLCDRTPLMMAASRGHVDGVTWVV